MEIEKSNHETMWKSARRGVVIFSVTYFLFEILRGVDMSLVSLMSHMPSAAFLVMVNIWITRRYVKGQIEKGNEMKNLLLMGISVSIVVALIIKLALWTTIYLLMKG